MPLLIGVLLATFTACTWGSISVLEARVSRALGGPSALAWIFGVGLVVILPIALIHGIPDASAGAWAWAMVAAGGSLAGLAMLFTAMQYGRVGLVAATISSQGAFASIFAAIGGESLHPLSFVAIAVSAAGTFVLIGAGGLGGAAARAPRHPARARRGLLHRGLAVCGLARRIGHRRRLGRDLRAHLERRRGARPARRSRAGSRARAAWWCRS